jgi:hypothetical protein
VLDVEGPLQRVPPGRRITVGGRVGQPLDRGDLAPSAWTASTVQLFTDRPSRWTVQAPQFEVSQPMVVPVLPSTSRR